MKNRHYVRGGLISLAVIILVTLFALALYSMGIRAENIFMLYTFGILIIIIETKEYIFGITSSFCMVAIFNYLFTEPRFTFQVNDKNYFVSFLIFLVISLIVTSLNVRIQNQMRELERSQKFTDTLYKVSSGYLHVSGVRQVAKYGLECMQAVSRRNYILFIRDRKNQEWIPCSNQEEDIGIDVKRASEWCYKQSSVCGNGTEDYPGIPYYMIPIVSKGITYGVLAMETQKKPVKEQEIPVIEAVVSIIAMALDRESANEAEQESKLDSERERIKNSLLRSISHDLRTPLAGITGSATFLLESFDQVEREGRETLLRDIVNDSVWLGSLVDNLLNMTRIQEGKLKIHYEDEVAEDIVSEVNARIQRRIGRRRFRIETPEECLTVPMDGSLIIQVLINLLDNAIKHTDEDGEIFLKVEQVEAEQRKGAGYARFLVSDNGTGIPKDILDHMFESFVTSDTEKGADCGRGMGLGLSIASEIIRVHKGMTGAYNNEEKGATVYFMLPMERVNIYE